MSTLISELEATPAITDGDFVQNILNEMNSGGGQVTQPPPAVGGPTQGVISAANPNTIAPHVLDNGPATAHVIGNSQPTAADFAQMMGGGGGGGQVVAAPQGDWGGGAPVQAMAARPVYTPPRKGWWARIIDELRAPAAVAFLVLVFSLPVVNFLFAHYIPWMVKSTGELTMVGLLIKSAAAGVSYWILQRVVVPLLSL